MGSRERSLRTACAPLESLENRRLFSFAAADASFGDGGLVRLFKQTPTDYFDTSKPTLVPLADGRSILYAGGIDDLSQYETTVRYLRADGSTDTSRGHNGEIGVHFAQYDTTAIAVDPKSGRMAVYAPTYGGTNADFHSGFKIDLYDAKGKKVDTYSYTNTNAVVRPSTRMTFASDGGLIIATQESLQINDNSLTQLVVRRLDKSLNRLKSFGDNGVFTLVQSGVSDAKIGYLSAAGPALDAKGNIYLNLFERKPDASAGGNRYIDRVLRLTKDGERDTTYGTDGVFTVFDRPQNEHDGSTRIIPLDAAVRNDGTIVLLTATTRTGADVTAQSRLDVTRITPGKPLAGIRVGRTQYVGIDQSGRVALDADGDIYVSTRLGGGDTQVFRYQLNKKNALEPVDSWSDFGDAAQLTINISEGELAVDAAGRVMVVGEANEGSTKSSPVIYRFDGRTTFAKVDAGARLLKDGTLLVKGGGDDDEMTIDRNADGQITTRMGQTLKTFDRAKVHGVLVLGGRGNDLINVGTIGMGVYVDGGSGNDTLNGSDDRDDTLVGSDGNDLLTGQAGNDHLYGQDGNDLLLGGNGGDELFGGAGIDRLYASGDVSGNTSPDDFITDVLDGGKGADVIRFDVVTVYYSQRDVLQGRDDSDTIING